MKKIQLLLFFNLMGSIGFGQYVVNNVRFNDIDDYDQVDSLVAKYSKSMVECYQCKANNLSKDSCALIWRKRYDKDGKLIGLTKGDNITIGQIEYIVEYRRLSDSTYESVCKFPLNSKILPEYFFVDSLENGRHKNICLYARDKSKNIIVRSEYFVGKQGVLAKIERYDLSGVLRQLFFPIWQQEAKEGMDGFSIGGIWS